jgi:hypothetical protein
MNQETFFEFYVFNVSKFKIQAKRKQALLESNLPGITCSTGMVKGVGGSSAPYFLESFQEFMPAQNSFYQTLYSFYFF